MTPSRLQQIAMHLPAWVPEAARHYIVHTEAGLSIRALARAADCHASTILRQVRRYENRRDDPLVDDALRALAERICRTGAAQKKDHEMTSMHKRSDIDTVDMTAQRFDAEALPILRHLCAQGAVLAVARDMDMGVIVRDGADGMPERLAVASQEMAQALALRDWVACADPAARVARYHVTQVGRLAFKRLLTEAELRAGGFSEAQSPFAAQHRDMAPPLRHMRTNMAESPLTGLARRRDKDGKLFLSRDLVAAGERLREDFELAQMGPKVAQNWESFLTGPGPLRADKATGGSSAARARVAAALSDLGPGLGDVVLRVCCFLQGMEEAEQKLGWAARSGKIVLRIALQRLKRHYDAQGQFAPKIG